MSEGEGGQCECECEGEGGQGDEGEDEACSAKEMICKSNRIWFKGGVSARGS